MSTQKHDMEKSALMLNRMAIMQVISDLRKYREAAKKLLDLRYNDGFVDGCAMSNFADTVKSIEEDQEDGA